MRDLCGTAGVSSIAVVAHSMGGLALRYYIARSGATAIHTAIFVGTPHSGTYAAYLAWGGGGREMRPDSNFLRELNQRIRDVREGPDGLLYVLTAEVEGAVLRIEPAN